jgi:hypothetical protein
VASEIFTRKRDFAFFSRKRRNKFLDVIRSRETRYCCKKHRNKDYSISPVSLQVFFVGAADPSSGHWSLVISQSSRYQTESTGII